MKAAGFRNVLRRQCPTESLIAAFNFSGEKQTAVIRPDMSPGSVLLYTDWESFGGHTPREKTICTQSGSGLIIALQPFTGVLLTCAAAPAGVRTECAETQSEIHAMPDAEAVR